MNLNVFISQPMAGISEEEFYEERKRILDKCEGFIHKKFPDHEINIVPIDNYNKEIPYGMTSNLKRVWCLGDSIKQMAEADFIIFSKNRDTARGCKIEEEIANKYKMNYVDEKERGWLVSVAYYCSILLGV